MNKTTGMFVDIANLVKTTDRRCIYALDIEGAPSGTNQVSLVSGVEKNMYNTYCTGGRLSDGKKAAFATILDRAEILVGYNVESDITTLAKQNVDVSAKTVIIDLYFTVQALLAKGLINKNMLPKQDLQSVAEYYGIKNITGYHNSLVDATVTIKLFWVIYEKSHGFFWIMANNSIKEKMEGVHSEDDEIQEEDMNIKNALGVMDYTYEEPDVICKSSGNLYEALIMIGRKEQVIRMIKSEYDLYQKICKSAPGYPLRIFYQTVLAPGRMTAVRKFKEKMEKEKKALENVYNALERDDKQLLDLYDEGIEKTENNLMDENILENSPKELA